MYNVQCTNYDARFKKLFRKQHTILFYYSDIDTFNIRIPANAPHYLSTWGALLQTIQGRLCAR